MRVTLSSKDELKTLQEQLHGMPLWAGASWCHITVSNPLLPVWKVGKATGGASGRA